MPSGEECWPHVVKALSGGLPLTGLTRQAIIIS